MIWIAAVSYFGSAGIGQLVKSLSCQRYKEWRLLIVDNSGSVDEVQALGDIARTDSRISVLPAGRNLGYLGGARLAFQHAKLSDNDWFIISNTDLVIDSKDALTDLIKVQARDIGVVAPRVWNERGGYDSNPYWSRRPTRRSIAKARLAFLNVLSARLAVVLAALTVRYRKRGRRLCEHSSPRDIYAPHGSFMALSAAYFRRGGTLDFPLFLFGEELFIAETCRRYGLRVRYLPEVAVRHVGHEATGIWRSSTILQHQVNSVRYCYNVIVSGVDPLQER